MKQVDLSRDNLALGSFGGAVFVGSGVIGLVGLGVAYGLKGIGGDDAFKADLRRPCRCIWRCNHRCTNTANHPRQKRKG